MSARFKRWALALASPFIVVAWARALLWAAGVEWGEKSAAISLILAIIAGVLSVAMTATIEAESGGNHE